MRSIGQIESEAAARRFSDFLLVQNISNQVELRDNRWDIWVHSEDDLERARTWLSAYVANPNDKQFDAAAKAGEVRSALEKDQEEYEKRIVRRGQLFRRFVAYGVGPLTALIIGVCVAMFVWENFSDGFDINAFLWGDVPLKPIRSFLFGEHAHIYLADRFLGTPEIRSGDVWRLVTPIFLHFGIIHILFNMMWLRDLGGMIETVEGSGKLLVLIIVSAVLSNSAQYVVTGHPVFGGMSGVIYALLGYVWMKGKYHPGSGLYLHRETVNMMLIWLVICFTGLIGRIANYAHLGGLVVGVAWGYLSARRR